MNEAGLWANIWAKRRAGKKMRKKGEKGAPTARIAGQSSLLGFVGQPQIRIEKDALGEALKQAISSIDPDAMSPRQAHEAIYQLLRIMEEEK